MGIGISKSSLLLLTVVVFGGLMGTQAAAAISINFDGFANGQIIDSEVPGVVISADNMGGGPDLAVIFDERIVQGGDPDLNGGGCIPGDPANICDGTWAVGNLAPNTVLNNLLIVQENGVNQGGFISTVPDDEAGGGTLKFDFQECIKSFGMDAIDAEGMEETPGSFGSISFRLNNVEVATRDFENLVAVNLFGDNSANRFAPITSAVLGTTFDEVWVIHDGSGAVDNIEYEKCDVVGGAPHIIDKTALLVTGAQVSASWMIPLLVSAIGIGVFVVTRKE